VKTGSHWQAEPAVVNHPMFNNRRFGLPMGAGFHNPQESCALKSDIPSAGLPHLDIAQSL